MLQYLIMSSNLWPVNYKWPNVINSLHLFIITVKIVPEATISASLFV